MKSLVASSLPNTQTQTVDRMIIKVFIFSFCRPKYNSTTGVEFTGFYRQSTYGTSYIMLGGAYCDHV